MINIKTAYCFDLDGTLTKQELLPLIAKGTGIYEEIEALTTATIQGVIPFQSSFKLRCKLLGDIPVEHVHKTLEIVEIYEELKIFIEKNKENCFIVTGNLDIWISPLVKLFGCGYYSSKAEVDENGKIKDVTHVINKAEAISKIKKEFDTVVCIGDGMGDVAMFENADIGVAFGQTHDPIKSLIEVSDYIVFEEAALCRLLNTL